MLDAAAIEQAVELSAIWDYMWPLLLIWFNFNPSMDNNHIHYKVWDEITYPFLNFNGCTVEV